MAVKIRRKNRDLQITDNEDVLLHINKDEQTFLRELMKYHRSRKTKYLEKWWKKLTE